MEIRRRDARRAAHRSCRLGDDLLVVPSSTAGSPAASLPAAGLRLRFGAREVGGRTTAWCPRCQG
ncbi:MAG: hypothetical protein R3F11_00245 [Verrucomicrobiales bacterium]